MLVVKDSTALEGVFTAALRNWIDGNDRVSRWRAEAGTGKRRDELRECCIGRAARVKTTGLVKAGVVGAALIKAANPAIEKAKRIGGDILDADAAYGEVNAAQDLGVDPNDT